jgi:hypothetical protein
MLARPARHTLVESILADVIETGTVDLVRALLDASVDPNRLGDRLVTPPGVSHGPFASPREWEAVGLWLARTGVEMDRGARSQRVYGARTTLARALANGGAPASSALRRWLTGVTLGTVPTPRRMITPRLHAAQLLLTIPGLSAQTLRAVARVMVPGGPLAVSRGLLLRYPTLPRSVWDDALRMSGQWSEDDLVALAGRIEIQRDPAAFDRVLAAWRPSLQSTALVCLARAARDAGRGDAVAGLAARALAAQPRLFVALLDAEPALGFANATTATVGMWLAHPSPDVRNAVLRALPQGPSTFPDDPAGA